MMSDEKKTTEEELDDGCLDFDSVIEDDGQEFILLPDGEYTFLVENMERGRFKGSAKLPSCNKVSLTLRVNTGDNKIARIFTDLILHKTLEWKLSAFFRSIGQKKRGEKLTMDWEKVVGATGRAHIKVRNYTNKNGESKECNDVDNYIDWDDKFAEDAPKADFSEISEEESTDELPF